MPTCVAGIWDCEGGTGALGSRAYMPMRNLSMRSSCVLLTTPCRGNAASAAVADGERLARFGVLSNIAPGLP